MSEEKPTVSPAQPAPAPQAADIENVERIEMEDVVAKAHEMLASGHRFVTLTCTDKGDGSFDVMYHFDRDLTLSNFVVTVPAGQNLPSITAAYLCAFLVENEIGDHFGLKVDGMPLDFQQHLVLAANAEPTPLLKHQGQQ